MKINPKHLFLLSVPFLVCSCGGNTPKEDDYKGDGYIDTLPSKTEDGNIFHAFCWTYNEIKANLETLANSGFKSVQTSPVQQPKSNGASWWAFYQPLSFSISDNSPLGTKQELKELCDEAEKYTAESYWPFPTYSDLLFGVR